ncbi:MAG: HDOD domain-containing protein [Armatimonadota bacterium]
MMMVGDTRRDIERAVHDLPALPSLVMRLVELVESENATAEQVERLITADPALTAKVLHLANSAYYGLTRAISTVKQAVIVLGFHTVKNLVLGISAFMALRGSRSPSKVELGLWEHSFACAGIAREMMLAHKQSLRQAENVFMAGLLHDIGVLFLYTRFPKEYQKVLQSANPQRMRHEVETEILGMNHAEVGALITDAWGLPTMLVSLIGNHHAPYLPEGEARLPTACLMVADHWSHQHIHTEYEFSLPVYPPEADTVIQLAEEKREALIKRVLDSVAAMRQVVAA